MVPEFPPQFWLAGIVAYTGVVAFVWKIREMAVAAMRRADGAHDGIAEIRQSRAEDKKINDARLERAEANHDAIMKLSGAVDRFTDRFTLEMKHLTERHEETRASADRQFGELKAEIKHIRSNRAMAAEGQRRRRPSEEDA